MIRIGTSWPIITALLLMAGMASGASSPVKPDESVVFLSGLGHEAADGWHLEIHGWIFESEYHKPLTSLFRHAIGIRDDELTATEQATFRERAQFFLVDNERNKSVAVQIGSLMFHLPNSTRNGHFQTNLHLLSEDVQRFGLAGVLSNRVAQFQITSSNQRVRPASGMIQILPATGLSVISDIDDTIKLSSVRDHRELLRNTFCRPYQAVPGMAALYQTWEKTAGARFHYVSASPWQLYVPLSEFVHTNSFPDGTFHLKTFRLKDHTAFDLFKSPEKFKFDVIEPLLKEFPQRRFVLVGDSGEKDPEIYAALARKFPSQISRIFIRDTTGERRESMRYRNAFSGVATNVWTIFLEPAEIAPEIR
jgi:hypothetical protein